MGRKGFFITFEGPEGCGKTTHSRLLVDFLEENGYPVVYTREPGGVAISEKIRKVLLDPKNKDMDTVCEMLLYMASRAQIMKEKILPALEKGDIVVCDRFIDATIAYQGYAGGIDIGIIKTIGSLVTKDITPDLTIILDIDVRTGLKRRGAVRDRIERRPFLFHKKVRDGYLLLAKREPRRMKVLSSRGGILQTQERIRKVVMERLCHFHLSEAKRG